jgi:hypothetical protein
VSEVPGRGLKGICAWLEADNSEAQIFLKILFKNVYITKSRKAIALGNGLF